MDWNLAKHRYFTLYGRATIDVFGSEPYRARLNAPSAWANRVQPHYANFVRSACRTIVSAGKGHRWSAGDDPREFRAGLGQG